MAKRNKNKSKQRRKRYLRQRILEVAKAVPTVTKIQEAPSVKLYLGKYAAENEQYQRALDAIYEGKVKPFDRYINPNATLVHYCSGCKRRFYGRPQWMLGMYPHVCFSRPSQQNRAISKPQKENSNAWDDFHRMVQEDLSPQEIAKKMGVNPLIIKDYFEKEGLI